MKVLVAYATAAGSTVGVAQRIAEVLRAHGHVVSTSSVDQVTDAENYDAYVVGSAVHDQAWLPSGAAFLSRERRKFVDKPVWLFSVGPLGTEIQDEEEQPKQLDELREKLRPRDHRLFFGVLDRDKLGFGERMMVKAVKAPEGDFRNWDEIRAWADGIATELA